MLRTEYPPSFGINVRSVEWPGYQNIPTGLMENSRKFWGMAWEYEEATENK